MQLDVIQILAHDEKGHSNRGLAKLLNKHQSSTKRAMGDLQIDIAGAGKESLYIHYLDIKNPVGLASEFLKPSDPVSRYINDSSSEIRSMSLDDIDLFWNGVGGLMSLIGELNRLLDGPSLFDEDRFKKIRLTDATLGLAESDPEGLDLLRLNRLLLEEMYPDFVSKHQKPIVLMGSPRRSTRKRSRHPEQQEFPYYLNRDLAVFKFINDDILGKMEKCQVERDRLRLSRKNRNDDSGMSPERIIQDNRYGNLFEYLCRLRYSDYVRNLIRDYGLRMTFEFLANGPIEEFMLADIVDRADMLGCITRDEDAELVTQVIGNAFSKYDRGIKAKQMLRHLSERERKEN